MKTSPRRGARRPPVSALLGLLAVTVLAVLGACRFEVGEEEDLQESIESMLRRGADAWNAGDLDGYLATYSDASSTTITTPDGRLVGLSAIRDAYAPLFEPGATRDSVRLEDLDIRALPPLIGIVTGRYVMERGGREVATGWFTLVVRRVGGGWRIVHEHSS